MIDSRSTERSKPVARLRRGFTLIELLVVISIISIMVTLIVPAFYRTRIIVMRVICGTQMRQIGLAWMSYATTNKKLYLVGSDTYYSWDWCQPWGDMKNGALYKYIQNPEVYKCLSPANPGYPVSYSMSGRLNGEYEWPIWKTYLDIAYPGGTMLLVEEDDWRGYNVNSFVITSENQWTDYVAGNHDNGDNVIFADTHIEYFQYKWSNTLLWPHHDYGFYMTDPGNPDLARYWRAYMGGESR